ncbi:MAG: TetR/AcrR family transcriptional regulator [Roseburia sp.]
MNPSTNPSALRSKNEITNSLLRLMEQYPYAKISIKQILLEAQVARKTFYRNFSDKDDVLDAYLNTLMTEYVTTLQQIKDCGIANVLDVIFDFCILHKDFLMLLHKNHLMHLLLDKWNTFIPNVHDQIIDKNSAFYQSCKNLNMDYILAFNIGAVWNIIVMWMEHDIKESPKELKQTILNYLTNMLQFM